MLVDYEHWPLSNYSTQVFDIESMQDSMDQKIRYLPTSFSSELGTHQFSAAGPVLLRLEIDQGEKQLAVVGVGPRSHRGWLEY